MTTAVLCHLEERPHNGRMENNRRQFLMASAAASGILLDAQTTPEHKPDIFEAAASGDVPRATELADANPEIVRQRSSDGRTPLHFASAAGKPAMVQFLGSRGAELSAGPESPLLAAVDYPEHDAASEMSTFLLSNASDPNARRKDGKTALQLAKARGYDDMVEMLIHRGAVTGAPSNVERVHFDRRYLQDVNGKPYKRDDTNGQSWTAINRFVVPAHFDFEKVKKLYTENPALLTTRATWDELAIEAAAHMGLVPMAEWLAEKGSPVSTCTAVVLGMTDRVKEALNEDRQCVYERGAHDIAILAYVSYGKEQANITELLLKAGANVHSLSLRLTPLHIAAMKGYIDVAGLLLDHGADINAQVKSRGQMVTPLELAAQAKRDKMEQFLKSRGAKA
jgi:ankyrin repeat protein